MSRAGWAPAVAALALAACAAGDPVGGPPEVVWGAEECDRCRMIVDDARYAAVARIGGEALAFDDAGCLAAYLGEQRSTSDAEAWLADREGGGWIEARTAWLVAGSGEVTPMGSGLVAFAERARAEGLARSAGGRLVRWDELGKLPEGGASAAGNGRRLDP